jgi:diguanylate cyclase (GGDEF)-like protein
MRILVAEDDPVALGFLELSLAKWGYSVEVVTDGEAALEALRKPDAPKLAILDWVMPKMDGVQVCREMRKTTDNNNGYIYIILLTVKSSLFDMVDGIAAGADDYIIKPFIPQDLKVRLDAGKRIVELQEKLLDTRKTLISSSSCDLGTRTWNREKILLLISAELNRSKRKGRSQSIALMKIDNYSELLEKTGAKRLDEFLCNSLNRIQNTVRSYDSIGRYSDDEFLMLFPETTSEEMPGIMARLFKTIHGIELSHTDAKLPFSVTMGVVTCQGDIAEETLISEVNKAITKAPQEGASRVHFSVVR